LWGKGRGERKTGAAMAIACNYFLHKISQIITHIAETVVTATKQRGALRICMPEMPNKTHYPRHQLPRIKLKAR